jgi:hypothetical protein
MHIKYILRDSKNQYYNGDIVSGYWTTDYNNSILFDSPDSIKRNFAHARKNSQLINAVEPIEIISVLV